jgi:hypothetical protein
MPVSQALKQRWNSEKLDKHPLAVVARRHFHQVLDARDAIEAKRTELAADKTLSDLGRRQKLQDLAKGQAGHVAKAQRALTAARDKMRDQRKALMPTVRNKADLASAMLRQEARAFLRGKTQAEAVALLFDPNADSIIIEAVFEAPTTLSGISADVKDKLLAAVIERTAGPALVALSEQDDAIDLLDAALRVSAQSLRAAVDVHPGAFDKWLAEVAPIDPKEARAEAAKISRDVLAQSATALPLAERMSLVDQLLAANMADVRTA